MILQGKTPRSLTFTGLFGVAGVGMLLLPVVFSWGQTAPNPAATPQGGNPSQPRQKPDAPNQDARDAQLQAAREDIRLLQKETEKLQQELQKRQDELQRTLQQRSQQLQRAMQRLEQLENAREPGGNRPGGPGGFPGQDQPGGPGGGQRGGPGGFGGGPGGGNLEQRLNQVEKKLDTLLQEIRALRNDMKQGSKTKPGTTRVPNQDPTKPRFNDLDNPNPNPTKRRPADPNFLPPNSPTPDLVPQPGRSDPAVVPPLVDPLRSPLPAQPGEIRR